MGEGGGGGRAGRRGNGEGELNTDSFMLGLEHTDVMADLLVTSS